MSKNDFGARAKSGKHVPRGIKAGVRRGIGKNGHLLYNGHPHVPEQTKGLLLKFLAELGRPATVREVASEVGYSVGHTSTCLRAMAVDGDVAKLSGGNGQVCVYGLPGVEGEAETGHKVCARCRVRYSLTDFQRDRSQSDGRCSRCRYCRSPKGRKARRYPDLLVTTQYADGGAS